MKTSIILFFSIITTCVQAAKFSVISNPEGSEIYVKKKQNDQAIKIGATPYTGDLQQLASQYQLGQVFFLSIKKDGYNEYNVLMTPTNQADVDIDVNLNINENIALTRKFDSISNFLFDAQRLTRDKNYDEALKMLEEAEKLEKNLSIINEMRGGIYYLKKDFNSALSAYRKAFALNTLNNEAYSMKVYLESTMGLNHE